MKNLLIQFVAWIKQLLAYFFAPKVFFQFFFAMIVVAILDLIGLGNGGNFGAGFVLTFLLFLGFIIYQMTKKT